VLFTVVALSQAAPLSRSPRVATLLSLSTPTPLTPLWASGVSLGQSHSGSVCRLVPFVVAWRPRRGARPVASRSANGSRLPCRAGVRPCGPPCLELPPEHTAPALAGLLPPRELPRRLLGTHSQTSARALACPMAGRLRHPFERPAGNHSRSRLKPSPISDRHRIKLVVRSREAQRLGTSGHTRGLSRRARLTHPP
jgi:hypothetical protein